MNGHLVVRAPNWVGDLVMATPVLAAAVADPRFERVTIVLRKHLRPVLEDGPLEPHLAVVEGNERELLAGLGADVALLLTNSFGAALRARRAGVPIRIGASLSRRGLLLTHRLVPPTRLGRRVPVPTAHLLRDVAGLAGVLAPDLHPRLWFSDERARRARGVVRALGVGDEPLVVCCPGAAFGAAKMWPPERFAQALDRLHDELGSTAFLTGAPSEKAVVDAVAAACRRPTVVAPEEERDLANLKVWVHDAALLLVGDSGPRWYAAAFDTPCVSVIGPNFEELTASSLEHCRVVRAPGLDCAPCLERVCPLAHHRCMRDLGADAVVEAAHDVLARAKEPRSGAGAR
ncbi:MAG: glycosyltransferase family 9 protein [Planctomycetota bacterium]